MTAQRTIIHTWWLKTAVWMCDTGVTDHRWCELDISASTEVNRDDLDRRSGCWELLQYNTAKRWRSHSTYSNPFRRQRSRGKYRRITDLSLHHDQVMEGKTGLILFSRLSKAQTRNRTHTVKDTFITQLKFTLKSQWNKILQAYFPIKYCNVYCK